MQKLDKLFIEAIKSSIITKDDDLLEVILKALNGSGMSSNKSSLLEGDIIVITSKVVAVTQGRIREVKTQKDFDKLVKDEADQVIGTRRPNSGLPGTAMVRGFSSKNAAAARLLPVTLTLKDGIFIPWAGIDRSNIPKGFAVLWPEKPFVVAADLQKRLLKIFRLKKLGVIISDSFCIPLRRGVSAVALSYAGFQGVNDVRGQKDLYGKPLKVTQQAMADNLATAANLVMGESNESIPFALIRNAPVRFTNQKIDPKSLTMEQNECIYSPLYL